MFEELLDPRRTQALRVALAHLRKVLQNSWNDQHVATTQAGTSYTGVLAAQSGQDFLFRGTGTHKDQILIGDLRDLPPGAAMGKPIVFTATYFGIPNQRPDAEIVAAPPAKSGPER